MRDGRTGSTGGARRGWTAMAAAVLTLLAAAAPLSPALGQRKADPKLLARGQYLATVMDCGGCHTPGAMIGKPDESRRLAGSDIGFGLGPGAAEGVVYPRNLTPDRETGLGAWTDDQIIRSIRAGQSRDGRVLVPVMPWPSYAALTIPDARALVAYLRSIPAVKFDVPANVKPGERPVKPYLTAVDPAK
jgi:mono/diheme cytochrome c family protein